MRQAAKPNPEDFLLLFPLEASEAPATPEPEPLDAIPREVHGATVLLTVTLTPTPDDDRRPLDVAPKVRESSGVRQVGIDVSPVGFIFGAAVGAFGMWMSSVPPSLPAITAVSRTAPAVAESPSQAPGNAGTLPRELPPVATFSPGPTAIVSSAPASIAVSDALNRRESAAAAPRRVSNLRPEASADAAPSVQYKGSLALYSGPPGARAFVDGRPVGSTPVVLAGLPVGSRVVRLEVDGYQTWSAAIRVIADQQTRVTATLYREPPRP